MEETVMPILKTRNLFISHAWSYDSHYNKVVEWLNEEPNFSWKNYSVPSHDACSQKTTSGLKQCLTNQINPSQCVIILAGMWVAHSEWIQYEIDEALRLGKTIIGVRPWGQEKTPTAVQNAADVMVNWQSASIIQAIRDYV
jgi:hypothetical protein